MVLVFDPWRIYKACFCADAERVNVPIVGPVYDCFCIGASGGNLGKKAVVFGAVDV